MRNVNAPLLAHLQGARTTTALCWLVEPVGKPAEGYTSHDQDLTFAGITYQSTASALPTAIPASAGLSVDAVEVTTLLPPDGVFGIGQITPQRLQTGYYNGAWVSLFLLNYANAANTSELLTSGKLGKASRKGKAITFELLPLSHVLNEPMGVVTTPICRYPRFGRGHCRNAWGLNDGPDIATRTKTGTVQSGSKSVVVVAGFAQPDGWAEMGILRFTGGLNAGVEAEIRRWQNNSAQLALSLPFAPVVGDSVAVEEGCNRTWAACLAKANTQNFGGHPFLPGQLTFQKRYETEAAPSPKSSFSPF